MCPHAALPGREIRLQRSDKGVLDEAHQESRREYRRHLVEAGEVRRGRRHGEIGGDGDALLLLQAERRSAGHSFASKSSSQTCPTRSLPKLRWRSSLTSL